MRSARLSAERRFFVIVVIFVNVVVARRAAAQTFTQRGFLDGSALLFAQEAPNDPTRAVGDFVARAEASAKWAQWIQVAAGVEVRANSHDQVEDRWRLDASDRGDTNDTRARLEDLCAAVRAITTKETRQ